MVAKGQRKIKETFRATQGRDLLTFRGCALGKWLCSLDNRMERFKSSPLDHRVPVYKRARGYFTQVRRVRLTVQSRC